MYGYFSERTVKKEDLFELILKTPTSVVKEKFSAEIYIIIL